MNGFKQFLAENNVGLGLGFVIGLLATWIF